MAKSSGPHPDLRCPTCGVLVEMAADRIVDHLTDNSVACVANGRLAEIPRVTVSAPYACDACGQLTKSNLRTGVVHSHNLPNDTRVCTDSGRFIGPIGASVILRLLSEPAEGSQSPRRTGCSDEATASVRTVRGGRPGLGRRR